MSTDETDAEFTFEAPCDVSGCNRIATWRRVIVSTNPTRHENRVDCPEHRAIGDAA